MSQPVPEGMLLEWVDLDDIDEVVALVENDHWIAQQKMDGARAIVHVTSDGIDFYQRGAKPLVMSACAVWFDELREQISALNLWPDTILDCELVHQEGMLWIFDLIRENGKDLAKVGYALRRFQLENLIGLPKPEIRMVGLLPEAAGTIEKGELLQKVIIKGCEGVVFKKFDGHIEPGVRSKTQLKAKVFKTADVVVTGRNTGGALNATLSAYDGAGNLVEIGACSMIGKEHIKPVEIGDVIEVRYIYATAPSMRMYGPPSMTRHRDDKSAEECLVSQLVPVSRKLVLI